MFNSTFVIFGLAAWGYALIYGCIWFYKFNRDQKIIERAQVSVPQEQVQQAIEMPSSHRGRYFVPPPLDRR